MKLWWIFPLTNFINSLLEEYITVKRWGLKLGFIFFFCNFDKVRNLELCNFLALTTKNLEYLFVIFLSHYTGVKLILYHMKTLNIILFFLSSHCFWEKFRKKHCFWFEFDCIKLHFDKSFDMKWSEGSKFHLHSVREMLRKYPWLVIWENRISCFRLDKISGKNNNSILVAIFQGWYQHWRIMLWKWIMLWERTILFSYEQAPLEFCRM